MWIVSQSAIDYRENKFDRWMAAAGRAQLLAIPDTLRPLLIAGCQVCKFRGDGPDGVLVWWPDAGHRATFAYCGTLFPCNGLSWEDACRFAQNKVIQVDGETAAAYEAQWDAKVAEDERQHAEKLDAEERERDERYADGR